MLNLIKMPNAAITALAHAAFTKGSTEQQQREFLEVVAKLNPAPVIAWHGDGNFGFTFNIDDSKSGLDYVIDNLQRLTKRGVEMHKHNDVTDITCDIVKDKYRVIIRHDYYDGNVATIQIYTLGA